MKEPKTVVSWIEPGGIEYRIQVTEIPGSAHWSILKDARWPDSDGWERLTAAEATTKPNHCNL